MFPANLRDTSPALAAVGFTVLSQEGGMLPGKARALLGPAKPRASPWLLSTVPGLKQECVAGSAVQGYRALGGEHCPP